MYSKIPIPKNAFDLKVIDEDIVKLAISHALRNKGRAFGRRRMFSPTPRIMAWADIQYQRRQNELENEIRDAFKATLKIYDIQLPNAVYETRILGSGVKKMPKMLDYDIKGRTTIKILTWMRDKCHATDSIMKRLKLILKHTGTNVCLGTWIAHEIRTVLCGVMDMDIEIV